MDAIRPLRDVFAGLAGDEDEASPRDHGPADLPDDLLTEAIISYVDTAPAEVAAHLAPFVTSHSPVPQASPAGEQWDVTQALDLLASAPTDLELSESYDFEGAAGLDVLTEPVATQEVGDAVLPDPVELGFGHGHDVLADLDGTEGLEEDQDVGVPAPAGLEEDPFASGPIAVDEPDVADDFADEQAYGAGRGTVDGDDQPAAADGGADDAPDA